MNAIKIAIATAVAALSLTSCKSQKIASAETGAETTMEKAAADSTATTKQIRRFEATERTELLLSEPDRIYGKQHITKVIRTSTKRATSGSTVSTRSASRKTATEKTKTASYRNKEKKDAALPPIRKAAAIISIITILLIIKLIQK